MREEWKDIKGFEGLYQISNLGRVKSLYKNIIRKPQKQPNGYLFLTLHKDGKIYNLNIHRTVAFHFLEIKEGKEINHKDGNKENNVVDLDNLYGDSTNLEWITKSENQKHAVKTGLRKTGDYVNTFLMKPILCFTVDGVFIKEFDCTKRAAKELGLDSSTITKILKGKNKSTKGYKFIYKL